MSVYSQLTPQLIQVTNMYYVIASYEIIWYSHEVHFKKTTTYNSCRSLAVLLSGLYMIVMNLSETAPESIWWRFKRCRREDLASSRAGHSTQKCCSWSSICPLLHDLHILFPTDRPMYLPVSICNGAVPPLRHTSRDLWDFTLTFCSPYSAFKLMYDLNFGFLFATSPLFQVEETANE